MEFIGMTKETFSSYDDIASDDSMFSKDMSDTTYSGKDEFSNYQENESCLGEKVELKARSLFFDSIPKRNCKRKRMKKDHSKKTESACASSRDEVEVRDPSIITIKAIHIYPKESSISSTFTSENSFQPKETSPKKNQIDDGKRQSEYENIMYVSHPHYKRTQLLTDLSQSVAFDGPNDLNINTMNDATVTREALKYAERFMTIDGGERLSLNEVAMKNKEFLSSLPKEFLPYIDHNPSIFEYAPISLSKAVGLSRHAR